jgi:tetratricopeptide (TPR) repeat protein
MNQLRRYVWGALLAGALLGCGLPTLAADTNTEPSAAGTTNDAASQETLRAYLYLQEQIHATRLALERSREEAEAAATRNAEALAARLQTIEVALASQRVGELQALQSSNRVMLIVAGTVAGVGLLAVVLMAFSHWRALGRLADIARSLPARTLAPAAAAIGAGDTPLVTLGAAEQSNERLLGALDRLEKRIYELEHTAHPPLSNGTPSNNEPKAALPPASDSSLALPPGAAPGDGEASKFASLLGKGQSLLNLDHAEEALACFEQVLAQQPNHAEALVKKGTALERLRKFNEAIGCYDRAIAADSSMTIAYLYKGGLFNRMERFTEALECYEQALRTQEKTPD